MAGGSVIEWQTVLSQVLGWFDARVDLQEVLNHVYDVYGYEDFVYSGTPAPALSPKDVRWARQVLGDLFP